MNEGAQHLDVSSMLDGSQGADVQYAALHHFITALVAAAFGCYRVVAGSGGVATHSAPNSHFVSARTR